MNQLPEPNTVIWHLHADKLLWLRDNGIHTSTLGFNMVASWFNHTPPLSVDIEYAIQLIEDGLKILKVESFAVEHWETRDKIFGDICQRLGQGKEIGFEQFEQYFQTVMQSLKQPKLFQTKVLSNSELAYILILREAMCHLNMSHLRFIG